ncbi:MAG: DUF1573 domain-containing protein [Desulfobacterales bacterium]|nr:DUF1573 domain-containing protein [Desulfobacterales bacterium]
MKKIAIGLLVFTILAITPAVFADQGRGGAGVSDPEQPLPAAAAMEPRFDFGTAVDGSVIVHDFIIRNHGNAPLRIDKVKTVCGCTSVDYDKVIQPDGEGKITIKASTWGYGGKVFSKPITVFTNDPGRKRVTLRILGKVERFARIEPRGVLLEGVSGDDIRRVVSITPEEKYPFNIVKTWSRDPGERIECVLEKKDGAYLLTVSNLVETPGRYRDAVHLKTDSPTLPEIVIHVRGVISPKKS